MKYQITASTLANHHAWIRIHKLDRTFVSRVVSADRHLSEIWKLVNALIKLHVTQNALVLTKCGIRVAALALLPVTISTPQCFALMNASLAVSANPDTFWIAITIASLQNSASAPTIKLYTCEVISIFYYYIHILYSTDKIYRFYP